MKFDSVVSCVFENTSSPVTLAPGAAPVMWMSQPAGSGWLTLTNWLRSNFVFPCAAIELASRNDSIDAPPPVGKVSPVKLMFVTTGEPVVEPLDAYAAFRWKSWIVVSILPAM